MRDALRSRAALLGLLAGVPLSAFFSGWPSGRPTSARSELTEADVGLTVLAVGAMVGVSGQAVRWRAIARIPGVSTARFGEMVVSGIAVNNVLPGRVGDLLRARWLQVAGRIAAGRALATVFVDRGFDVLALVVFLAISLPFVASAEWLRRNALGSLVLLVALGLVLVAARLYAHRRDRARRSPLILPMEHDT